MKKKKIQLRTMIFIFSDEVQYGQAIIKLMRRCISIGYVRGGVYEDGIHAVVITTQMEEPYLDIDEINLYIGSCCFQAASDEFFEELVRQSINNEDLNRLVVDLSLFD